MHSRTETEALQIVEALYAATEGRPFQWRPLDSFHGFDDEALQHAVDQGWLVVEGGHSVCLTDHGRARIRGDR